MRILVVEDDAPLSNILQRSLREESYAVDAAADGIEGEWLAMENPYDLIILDIMLPRKNGVEVLTALRKAGNKTPILLLTAKDTVPDKVNGLDKGADDYLTKPFSLDELFARVRVLLRRHPAEPVALISVGPLTLDPARKEVTRDGKRIDLTAKEFALLEYLARNAGVVLSRTQLSEHVWDMNFEPTSNVIDVYIGYLRNKVDRGFGAPMLRTVRGHGYMLDVPEQETATEPVGASMPQSSMHETQSAI